MRWNLAVDFRQAQHWLLRQTHEVCALATVCLPPCATNRPKLPCTVARRRQAGQQRKRCLLCKAAEHTWCAGLLQHVACDHQVQTPHGASLMRLPA